ncbi:MAG TPA: hypothetical protein VMU48_12750 [Terracidiphilus sp.]|nr:hypothetical protein [Terracidiphilus sp.]
MELWPSLLVQTLNDTYFRMAIIVVPHKPAEKTHDDDGRFDRSAVGYLTNLPGRGVDPSRHEQPPHH